MMRWNESAGSVTESLNLHCLFHSSVGLVLGDRALGADCVRHARMFFDRPDFDLVSATPGTFAIKPSTRFAPARLRQYDFNDLRRGAEL